MDSITDILAKPLILGAALYIAAITLIAIVAGPQAVFELLFKPVTRDDRVTCLISWIVIIGGMVITAFTFVLQQL